MAVQASIDIGSNSVRLLVAEVAGGVVRPLVRQLCTTRLGQGRVGELPDDAIQRTLEALSYFRSLLAVYPGVEPVVVATSAVREAQNAASFLAQVKRVTGWRVKVLAGTEEAALSYRGATAALGYQDAVVVDIGGGSTEIAFPANGRLELISLPVGAVRMLEAGEINDVLEPALTPVRENGLPLVGVGGTLTSLAAMHHRLAVYDPETVHGTVLTLGEIQCWEEKLGRLPVEERQQLPGLQPQRADIIVAGTAIARATVACCHREEITVSEADLLWALLEEASP